MPQSLVYLPKAAEITGDGWGIRIKDHRVVDHTSLFLWMCRIIQDNHGVDVVSEFEKHGITYEIFTEYVVSELEVNINVFERLIWFHINIFENIDTCSEFAASREGSKIIDEFVEKIRSCDNWTEFIEAMKLRGSFIKEITEKVKILEKIKP